MTRPLRVLLALALAAAGLAVGTGGAASAAAGEPTLDGPADRFVSGTSFTVSGTDPAGVGSSVVLELEGVQVATATVQPDGTWSAEIDIAGKPDDRYGLLANVTGTSLFTYVWVHNDTSTVVIDSPASGSTITTTTDGCIPVDAHIAGATGTVFEWRAYAAVGSGLSSAGMNVDGTDLSACIPASTVPNGAGAIWVSLRTDERRYLARVPVTVALTSTASPVLTVGTDGITIRGTITHPAADTVVTARLDGGEPVDVDLPEKADPYGTTSWRMGRTFPVWEAAYAGDPYPVRRIADGTHSVTLQLTSRGTTTELGPYDVVVDGDGSIVIDESDAGTPGIVSLGGTLDNIDPGDGNFDVKVLRAGTVLLPTPSLSFAPATPKQYGQDRWSMELGTGPADGTPVTVEVWAFSRSLDVVCDAVSITGSTVTPASCGPTVPGVPTVVSATSSSSTSATVTVAPPAGNGGSPVVGYTATVLPWGSQVPTAVVQSATTSIPLQGLPSQTNQAVSVQARNAVGSSFASRDFSLYSSSVTCAKPASSVAVGKSISLSCLYDNGLREVNVSPPSVTLTVQALKPRSTTWTTVATKTAPLANNVSISIPATVTGGWSLRVLAPQIAAPAGYPVGIVRPARTATLTTTVTGPAPKLTLKLSSSTIRYGSSVTFSGTSTPYFAGQKVYLQRYASGAWRSVTSRTLSASGYRFSYKPTSRTDYRWRVWTPAAYGRPAGASASLLLTVQ